MPSMASAYFSTLMSGFFGEGFPPPHAVSDRSMTRIKNPEIRFERFIFPNLLSSSLWPGTFRERPRHMPATLHRFRRSQGGSSSPVLRSPRRSEKGPENVPDPITGLAKRKLWTLPGLSESSHRQFPKHAKAALSPIRIGEGDALLPPELWKALGYPKMELPKDSKSGIIRPGILSTPFPPERIFW